MIIRASRRGILYAEIVFTDVAYDSFSDEGGMDRLSQKYYQATLTII